MAFLTNCFETSFYNASIYRLLIWLFWHFFKMLLAWDTSGLILFQLDLFETLLAWSIWHASVDFPLKMLLSWDASGSFYLGRFCRFSFEDAFTVRRFWLYQFGDASIEIHLRLFFLHLIGDASVLISWRRFYLGFMEMFQSWRCFYLDFIETLLSWFLGNAPI